MEQTTSPDKPVLGDAHRLWLKTRGALVVSMLSAFVAAIGFDVQPKELIRPVLRTAGFFEVSVANQDTEALIRRIQEIEEESPDHPLIHRLRKLSKETASPFQGRRRDINVQLSKVAPEGDVGAVCPDSDLRDTYLQYLRSDGDLLTLRVVGTDACNHTQRDEVRLNPRLWDALAIGGRARDKLEMDVLLHRPVNL